MDYFGWTLWTELFLAHPEWMSSMELGESDEFDPEGEVWQNLFDRLANILNQSGLKGKLGACYHISSEIARWTGNFDVFDIKPKYFEARNKFIQQIPFDLGFHCQFSPDFNPLGKSYAKVFQEDLERAVTLESQIIVCHPPYNESYNHREILNMAVDDICQADKLEMLHKTNIAFAWENMIEGQFSQFEELLLLVHSLQDRMRELGYPDLAKRQQICFDTGHLCIWRANHFSWTKANSEIDRFLPQIGKELRVYHIHGNDGSSDYHVSPMNPLFMDHKTRAGLNLEKFHKNWESIQSWIRICEAHKTLDGRHIHLESDKIPFKLDQMAEFGRWYAKLLK